MPTKVFAIEEANVSFAPAAATDSDVTFEVDGLGTLAGHQSAQHDFGTSARSRRFAWRAFIQFATAPVIGEVVEVYLKTSSTEGHPDNDDGTGDAALSAQDKLRNLHQIGRIQVDEAVVDIEMVGSGTVDLDHRFLQVVFFNRTADALTTDVNENGFNLTPFPDEIQD